MPSTGVSRGRRGAGGGAGSPSPSGSPPAQGLIPALPPPGDGCYLLGAACSMPLPAPPSRAGGGEGLPGRGSTGPVAAKLPHNFLVRARWPFKRGSRPPSAAAAPGLSQATATTATYPAAGRGPPPRASQWLPPVPPRALIGRRGSRSAGTRPHPSTGRAGGGGRGRTWRQRCRRRGARRRAPGMLRAHVVRGARREL